jgi:hypothetical protein
MYNYAKIAHSALYHGCKTAILCNPEKMKYELNGITKIREYAAPKLGNYSKSNGWAGSGSKGDITLKWTTYQATHDRASVITVDAIDELNNCGGDMTPSIDLLNENMLNQHAAAEIDAANIASFFSQLPSGNKLVVGSSAGQYQVDASHIIETINAIKAKVFDAGAAGEIALFMASDVYANFTTALANNHALGNAAVIQQVMTVGEEIDGENEGEKQTIEVSLEVTKYDNMFIIEMPTDRMYSKIVMLDGQTAGQTEGGYVVDDDGGAVDVKLFFVPLAAGFTSTRYIVDNFLIPAMALDRDANVELGYTQNKVFGPVQISKAGVNQKANAWEYDARILYGGELFDNRKQTAFALSAARS